MECLWTSLSCLGFTSRVRVQCQSRSKLQTKKQTRSVSKVKADVHDVSLYHCEKCTHPHSRYFSRLLELDCGPDLLSKNLWPDAKEMSESFACTEAFFTFIAPKIPPISFENGVQPGSRCVLVVGDGSTPRTAALFAYQLKSRGYWCYSIDPQMMLDDGSAVKDCVAGTTPPRSVCSHQLGTAYKNIDNLLVHRGPIEELYVNAEQVVVVLMHAHVSMTQVTNSISAACKHVTVIACPCCNYATVQSAFQGRAADHSGHDWGIWSDKRHVSVWCMDSGTREGFYSHQQPVVHHEQSIAEAKSPAPSEKRYVANLICKCQRWAAAATLQDAYDVAREFYMLYPSYFRCADSRRPSQASNYDDWESCAMRLERDSSSEEIFEFTGHLCTLKGRLQTFGKKLLFFTLVLRSGRTLRVRVTEAVLHGAPLRPEVAEAAVPVTSALMAAALTASPSRIRVTGPAAVSPCGRYQVLSATEVKIHIPEPDLDVIRERLRQRREVMGMWPKAGAFYTQSGSLQVESYGAAHGADVTDE
eukprot:TRINITY_DN65997_c0_g1_i1.p1 TRINITY_DN65997_c0_g1~~TRINITY_DN65997_c0_g1_i1.p1  ORF type:complete len:546 (+),score=25.77 TRINITY_DN65997_c0_g1_i1:51-1640(+)